MKRIIISLSFATLAAAGLAAAQPGSTEEGMLDRTLPTYPELGFDGWRNNAGESETGNQVQVQIAGAYRFDAGDSESENQVQVQIAGAYRFDGGESTDPLVVQDVGSA